MHKKRTPIIYLAEKYAIQEMSSEVAHDFKHSDRVRNWALRIAYGEQYNRADLVEVAALLHDIGLPNIKKRSLHGQVGAEKAEKFLQRHSPLRIQEIQSICDAIRHHTTHKRMSVSAQDKALLAIIRDADMLDLFGAVGMMRAFTSKASKPEYDPQNIKGSTWGITSKEIDKRFEKGLGIGEYIIDQINFQISCFDNLNTKTAKKIARPLVQYMKTYVRQLEKEIAMSQ